MSQPTTESIPVAVRPGGDESARLLEKLRSLHDEMSALTTTRRPQIEQLFREHRAGAENLLDYVALRRHDLRPLQERLARLGLSSLGRSEAHTRANVEAVIGVLESLNGGAPPRAAPSAACAPATESHLERQTTALLGPRPASRDVRIMVTMPSEAARDYALVHELVRGGMDCMRINCAHDDAAAWQRMIANLRKAEQAAHRPCRVIMDLAGPKLRTGPVASSPGVVKCRPGRDAYGRVTSPARLWLTDRARPSDPPTPADACIPVPASFLARLAPGDRVDLRDARDAAREWSIVDCATGGAWAESFQTAYVVAETTLRIRRARRRASRGTRVGPLAPRAGALQLACGDTLVMTRSLEPGRPARHDSRGRLLSPASIGCTLPEIFDDVQPGESIWFDDGSIGGVVGSIDGERMQVRITQARAGGAKLRGDQGINLPDSRLRLSALTPKDLADLPFIVDHADAVAYSFVRSPQDVSDLQAQLRERSGERLGIVLKIETRQAFDQLPTLLLAAMRSPAVGVMIARGDLAIECGYERLAEVQEEILWMCEAAHLPVIWATQVLENLTKDGTPSRAEISDASIGGRAECVMLNKGPHVVKAVQVLEDILRRMQAHQQKKRSMLRSLHVATAFGA